MIALEGDNTRPTTDRVKESLFNLIPDDFYDLNVIDLFSGSGALGLEAASRGAAQVTCVEMNKKAAGVISQNIEKTRLGDIVTLKVMDASSYLDQCPKETVDMVLMDPPYRMGWPERLLQQILSKGILAEEALVVIEHESELKLPDTLEGLEKIKERTYGITTISMFRRQS